jgi:hypothetical protein
MEYRDGWKFGMSGGERERGHEARWMQQAACIGVEDEKYFDSMIMVDKHEL